MEREIGAIWPPQLKDQLGGIWAQGTAGGHVNDRGSDALIFILVGGQPRGVRLSCSDSFAQQQSCPLSFLEVPLALPTMYTALSISLSWAAGPLGGPGLQHMPEGTSLSFSERSPPWPCHTGLFSPGCDPRDPAPATMLAHSCLGLMSNPRECMWSPAEARDVAASRPGARRTFLKRLVLPWSNPMQTISSSGSEPGFQGHSLPSIESLLSEGGLLGLDKHLSLLCVGAHPPADCCPSPLWVPGLVTLDGLST